MLPFKDDLQISYQKAYHFAARAHGNQLYPGTEISYIMHLSFVSMEILVAHTHHPIERPKLAIQCALLHDTLEDTHLNRDALLAEFSSDVVRGVEALSKNLTLPKPEQMSDSLTRIRACPPEIGMVKLADRISNLQAPPSYWSREKCQRYHQEASLILDQLGHNHPYLKQRLANQIETYTQYTFQE